jgi:hypothetical protein
VGTGEVSVGERKLVGLSQRRTREGARFQCLVHLAWRPERWWPLVREAVPADQVSSLDSALADRVGEVGRVDEHGADLRDLLMAALLGELLALDQRPV